MTMLVKEKFIDQDCCNLIIEAVTTNRSEARHYSSRDELSAKDIGVVQPIRTAALSEVREFFGIHDLYLEFTVLTEMREGDAHSLHADNVKLDGTPNHTPQRSHTTMLYLNSGGGIDFAGGDLIFPALGRSFVPMPGLLVGFPCSLEYQHQVSQMVSGCRYALSIWYTTEIDRMER